MTEKAGTSENETEQGQGVQRWVIYLANIRDMTKQKVPVEVPLDYTLKFCEEYDLIEEFLTCKMNATAFYALARYKAGEIGIDGLEKCVAIINK